MKYFLFLILSVSTHVFADSESNRFCKKDGDCVIFQNGCGEFSAISKDALPKNTVTIDHEKATYFSSVEGCDYTNVRAPDMPKKMSVKCIKNQCRFAK